MAMRSAVVTLTLLPLGALALSHVYPSQEMRRNLYPDRATCEQDYSPQQCQQGIGSGTGYATSSWHGPYYYSNRASTQAQTDPGSGRMHWATATQVSMRGFGFGFSRASASGTSGTASSTRGGFGSFGRGFSASS
jgi:hypothetical protein